MYRPINNRSKMVANQESLQVIFYPCVASHDAYTRHSVASSLEGEDGHLIHPRNRSSILKGCTTQQRSQVVIIYTSVPSVIYIVGSPILKCSTVMEKLCRVYIHKFSFPLVFIQFTCLIKCSFTHLVCQNIMVIERDKLSMKG